jgi:hypothetical protein
MATIAVPLFLYYHQAVYLADGIMSKLLLYAAVVFNAILSRIKSSVSDSCTSNALISGRTMILRMQRSTIMVCFALVGYFVGHVEAQLYTNSTVSWDDFAVGTMFTNTTVDDITISLSPAMFFGGSGPLHENHIVQTGPTGGIPGNALTFEQTPITGAGQDITFIFSAPIYSHSSSSILTTVWKVMDQDFLTML